MTKKELAKTKIGKELQSDYSRLYVAYEKYKNFHDDVLEVIMHSRVMLSEPEYKCKEALSKILDKIENV